MRRILGNTKLAYGNRDTTFFKFIIYNMGMGSIFIEGSSQSGPDKILINADDCIKPRYYLSMTNKEFAYFAKYISSNVEIFPRGIDHLYSTLSKLSYSIKNNENFWKFDQGISVFMIQEELNCLNLTYGEDNGPYAYEKYIMPFQVEEPDNYKLYLIDQPSETKKLLIQFMILPKSINEIVNYNSDICDCTYFVYNPYNKKAMISDAYLFKEERLNKEYVRKQHYDTWYRKLNEIGIKEWSDRTKITTAIYNIRLELDSMIFERATNNDKKFSNIFFANYMLDYSDIDNIKTTQISIVFPNKKHKPKRFRNGDERYFDIFEHGFEKSMEECKNDYMTPWNNIK